MTKFKVYVSTGLVGSEQSETFEVTEEEALDEDAIEEQAKEIMFNMIEWGFHKVEEDEDDA